MPVCGEWTPERDATLRTMWPKAEYRVPDMWRVINAMPGQQFRHWNSLYSRAVLLGLATKRPPDPNPPPLRSGRPRSPPPEEIEPRSPEEEDLLEARAMIEAGRTAADIAEWFGWDLPRVRTLAEQVAAELRRERDAA